MLGKGDLKADGVAGANRNSKVVERLKVTRSRKARQRRGFSISNLFDNR